MSEPTLKSFAQLHDDYAFFEQHVSETEGTLSAWLPLVRGRWAAPHVLDFGAGSGSFSSVFLERAQLGPELRLTLVEPDPEFRQKALAALEPFTSHPIEAWPLLDREVGPSFDLITSHHVLYYVPDLEQTLGRLCRALLPGGRMLLVQGGDGNGMNQIVFGAFGLLGERPPYNYSEDTRAILERLGVELGVQHVRSVLDFPDNEENRWKILRFLLSNHLGRLDSPRALALFEPFVKGDRIVIESADELFVIDA